MTSITGRRYDTQEAVIVDFAGERIAQIRPLGDASAGSQLPYLAPGLVDLQVNGFGGQDFNDLELTVEKVEQVSLALDAQGVTGYCATVTTHSFQMLEHALKMIARAITSSAQVARRVLGIHLEGPYLSSEDGPRGAHPREHCRPPDWEEFQRLLDAAEGRILILTMSPEYERSAEFIRRVVERGVLVAIGHTSATSEQIQAAVDAGARMSTHLGNGAHGQIRRHPNYIWDQLADDRLAASLIVDGHHLPPSVVKSFVRAKGADRCVLVSDITGMAGMPAGRYEKSSLGAVEVLEDGRLVIAGQRQLLAGAALPLSLGVANVMHFAGVNLQTAIEMATIQPAQLIGCTDTRLAAGCRANLIQFTLPEQPGRPLQLVATYNAGFQAGGWRREAGDLRFEI